MSVDWLSRAWALETGSSTRKAVLICLADRADEYGRCWSSYRDLVERTEYAKSAVRRALDELEVDGFIERIAMVRTDGSDTSNTYQLLYWDGPKRPDEGAVRKHGGASRRHGGCRQRARGVPPEGTRTEPSREPSRGPLVTRGASRRRGDGPKRLMNNPPDDSTGGGDEEAPALGAAPRPSRAERDQRAASRGQSGHGLAVRFRDALHENGMRGSRQIVNVGAFAQRLVALHESGLDWDLLRTMVDIYVKNPDRYSRADEKAWVGFLTHAPKIEQDAKSHHKASASAESLYGNPYEGID